MRARLLISGTTSNNVLAFVILMACGALPVTWIANMCEMVADSPQNRAHQPKSTKCLTSFIAARSTTMRHATADRSSIELHCKQPSSQQHFTALHVSTAPVPTSPGPCRCCPGARGEHVVQPLLPAGTECPGLSSRPRC